MKRPVITVDGPVGAGKTTVAFLVSKALGYLFVDTGLYYRAVAWLMLRRGLDVNDEKAAAEVASELDLEIFRDPTVPGRQQIKVNGLDATDQLYSPGVEGAVSIVARSRQVREALLPKQRALLGAGGVVMAGRDIGTVVWPSAELKIYLDASVEERARRKYQERLQTHGSADYAQILGLLQTRDRIDSQRAVSPLRIPEDATYIDTNAISAEQVAQSVLGAVRRLLEGQPVRPSQRE